MDKKDYNYTPPVVVEFGEIVEDFIMNYEHISKEERPVVLEAYASLYNPACGYLAYCYI